jgi:hypothetical protein
VVLAATAGTPRHEIVVDVGVGVVVGPAGQWVMNSRSTWFPLDRPVSGPSMNDEARRPGIVPSDDQPSTRQCTAPCMTPD